jgi:hypothetical protein
MMQSANRRAASWSNRFAERLGGVVVALLLLRSALAHLANPYVFLDTIYSYRIVPAIAGLWIAVVLPFLQLVLGICLLAGWWRRPAYLLASALFVTFVGVRFAALWRGLDIACGCFGSTNELKIGWPTLALAGVCAVVCIFGWFNSGREEQTCVVGAAPFH